ncbi:MAG: transporter [Gemmatimonadales bacterium]
MSRRWVPLLAVALAPAAPVAAQESAGPIADNSFLIEEAYNQDPGVVQHINTFARPDGGGAWAYSFTQEWPFHGRTHQLSYSLPVLRQDGRTGIGDVALNYRYQLVADGEAGLHVAPRFTLLLPTGSARFGRGAGGLGLQTNLPASLRPTSWLAVHGNAGLTWTPRAENAAGETAGTLGLNLGASAIWLFRPNFNALVEVLWVRPEDVSGPGRRVGQGMWLVNPGLRWAFDFASGLQIVPGLAYTIALNDAAAPDALFFYLSFEHPFRH